ncbi:hypothetical protein TNCV_1832041 [Trichonephila clavipes]|nr:hypothetical protein TNCV_1832041 [Trichonephila clavipes]
MDLTDSLKKKQTKQLQFGYNPGRVITNKVHPVVLMVYSSGNEYFQQDKNAPSHTAGFVHRWLKEHDKDIILFSNWPAQLPDLNRIDNLWDETK